MGAGKFFPGGSKKGKAPEDAAPEPIRAEPPASKKPGLFPNAKSRFSKPVDSKSKPGVLLMSVAFCILFISTGWYYLAVRPARLQAQAMAAQLAQRDKEVAELKKKQEETQKVVEQKKTEAKSILKVDTRPTGAQVVVAGITKMTPATFEGLSSGKVTLTITLDTYHTLTRELVIEGGQTYDLGILDLSLKSGSLKLTSAQKDATYSLTGPLSFSQNGTLPATLEKLPEGTYTLTASHNGWQQPPITLTVSDGKSTAQEIKFPYGTLTIQSTPPGAIVRRGRQEIGQTPLTLSEQRPGLYKYSVEKEGYRTVRVEKDLKEFETAPITLTLEKTRDFTNSSNLSLVWMAEGYWVGKYEVTQAQYEQVMGRGANASIFRGANRPVENVTWQQATDFCNRLTEVEQTAGKLPAGYRYALPTEAQWNSFVGDANYDNAILAIGGSVAPASTADVGTGDPNQFGLYDVLGNVWEWCQDNYDAQGRTRTMRGGGWLSSRDTFPNKNTRNGGGVNYRDKFTGFRVVLIKQS